MPTLPLIFHFNRNLKPEDRTNMDQVLQIHQILNELFQWKMQNRIVNLPSHWAEFGETFQKICLRGISFKDLMEIAKYWNPNNKLKLREGREAKIKEDQATIKAIEEQ
ncbi:hypothetical protein O181_024991 [Austropuccinia psidii MF-1]|uniref:Uncharacterized protein n=1 Tax=Austropuccinia psidii MF-1 TaxID=1389203 RepID=A0A9Q3GZ49_9BASI|nr:hypothetical protein [Austropuccinia psidii MF-1]